VRQTVNGDVSPIGCSLLRGLESNERDDFDLEELYRELLLAIGMLGQATGAFHSRMIEKSIAAAKSTKANSRVRDSDIVVSGLDWR